MRTLLALCAITALIGTTLAFASVKLGKRTEHVTPSWVYNGTFRTFVDHFRAQDGRTVDFTYHANLNFTGNNGVVFILLKDAGDYTTQGIESGLIVDIARERNGTLFTFDYRYFGTNRPTNTTSFEDLQYLSPDQILADIGTFISYIQLNHDVYGENVIVVGPGYGGTIATWARKKFPHLVHAAWSSSGIFELVVASLNVYDSTSYSIYRTSGARCRDLVQEAFEEAEEHITNGTSAVLTEMFNLCSPINTTSTNDVSSFFQNFYDLLVVYIQQNHARGIQRMCDNLEGSQFSPLEAFSRYVRFEFIGDECYDASYASIVAERSNTSWDQPGTLSGRRQWQYIQCTQTGLFQITDSWTWLPNYVELPYLAQQCIDILGPNYTFDFIRGGLEHLRNQYGSLYLRSSRTIFSNGDVDPKMYNGIIYTNDPESVALNIQGHGRASDIPSIQDTDSAQLQEIKEQIIELIGNFSVPLGNK